MADTSVPIRRIPGIDGSTVAPDRVREQRRHVTHRHLGSEAGAERAIEFGGVVISADTGRATGHDGEPIHRKVIANIGPRPCGSYQPPDLDTPTVDERADLDRKRVPLTPEHGVGTVTRD